MTLEEAAAFYKLKLLKYKQLKDISSKWLDELPYSDKLFEIYSDPSLEIYRSSQFEEFLAEREVTIPNEEEANGILIKYFLVLIANKQCDSYEGMKFIDNYLDGHNKNDKEFLGEFRGLQHMYTWYRELQDAEDGSTLFYYADLPKEEAIDKFKNHLVEEAQKLIQTKYKT